MSVGYGNSSDQVQIEFELQNSNEHLWTIAQAQPLDLLDLNQPELDQSEQPQLEGDVIIERELNSLSSGVGSRFEGIWGLTKSVCNKIQNIEDIVDVQSLAIKQNQIIFSDSKCLIVSSEGEFLSGFNVSLNCLDADNQRFSTEIVMKPIGALKLELSSAEQTSIQYEYCTGLPSQ